MDAGQAVELATDHQRRGVPGAGASAEPAGAGHGPGRVGTDGEKQVATEALGRSGQSVYVRLADSRCRTNAIWLDAADVTRR